MANIEINDTKQFVAALRDFKASVSGTLYPNRFEPLVEALLTTPKFNDAILSAAIHTFKSYADLSYCFTSSLRALAPTLSPTAITNAIDILVALPAPTGADSDYERFFCGQLPLETATAAPEDVKTATTTSSETLSLLDRYAKVNEANAAARAATARAAQARAGAARLAGDSGAEIFVAAQRRRDTADLATGSFATVEATEATHTKRMPYASTKGQRAAAAGAWRGLIAAVGGALPKEGAKTSDTVNLLVVRRVLAAIPIISPWLGLPERLLDFYLAVMNIGGMTALAAIEGAAELEKSAGITIPKFYERLYALLTPEMLISTRTEQFLPHLDLLLSSQGLPAAVAAAFAKRLARLALTAPAPACLACIPVIVNVLVRVPAARCLVHTERTGTGTDPFDNAQSDPAKACALESCLWELGALANHYHPTVAAAAANAGRSLEAPLPVPANLGWGALVGAEASSGKPTPATAMPSGIFNIVVPADYKEMVETYDPLSPEALARVAAGTPLVDTVAAELRRKAPMADDATLKAVAARVAAAQELKGLFGGWVAGAGADEA